MKPPASASGRRDSAWIAVGGALWLVAMVSATVLVWRYKTTPAAVASDAPPEWPSFAPPRERGRATIVMLAHPKCPCTRASIGELAVLMSQLGDAARAYALFVLPSGTPERWHETDTWAAAAAIPGVRVLADPRGELSKRFGATVSGHTVVYRADGRLAFTGGITSARGHAGDNPGRRRIVALLTGGSADLDGAPTFGCELEDPVSARGVLP
jgi:hypothetical protein